MLSRRGFFGIVAGALLGSRLRPAVPVSPVVLYQGIPLIADPQCVSSRIYFIDPTRFARTMDFEWGDVDGAVVTTLAQR